MQNPTLNIPALAAEFTAALPDLDPSEQRLALTILRLLGEGEPFGAPELAARAERSLDEVRSDLDRLPMLQYDDQGRVVAYDGLSLKPTAHVLEVDGRTLYTWCALDALYLPELLGRPARIRSTSPESGEAISLTIDEEGVHEIAPAGAVMTLHGVSGIDLKDPVGTFCCYVNFFASEEAAGEWVKRNEGTYIASIAEGFEYGRLYNHAQLGGALAEEGAWPARGTSSS
jgi:alkylmercury lyase